MPETSATIPNLPHCFRALGEFLEAFQPPTEAFDPDGTWEHRYSVRLIHRWLGTDNCQPAGLLRLRRKPLDRGLFELDVLFAPLVGGNSERVGARVTCKSDQLATPVKWATDTCFVDPKGQSVPGMGHRERGRLVGGTIRRFWGEGCSIPAPERLTSSWSLFDALQRLPQEEKGPLHFAMLEEMVLLRANQRLAFRETIELTTAAGPLRLHGYEQFGEGILPYCYWLDDQRRLLFAIGGLRAFLYDPTATAPGVNT